MKVEMKIGEVINTAQTPASRASRVGYFKANPGWSLKCHSIGRLDKSSDILV
jgi:hypothetical protein